MSHEYFSGGQIHDRISSPADRPGHFLHLILNAGTQCGITDIGVDLDQKIATDDHWLRFRVIDVGGNDGTSACYFITNEFWRDPLLNYCTETLSGMLPVQQLITCQISNTLSALIFPECDKFHLRRDDAASGIVHLGDIGAIPSMPNRTHQIEAHLRQSGILQPFQTVTRGQSGENFGIPAFINPFFAQRRQAMAYIYASVRISIGAGSIIDIDWRVFSAPRPVAVSDWVISRIGTWISAREP